MYIPSARRFRAAFLAASIALAPVPAFAADGSAEIELAALSLSPGESLWQPERAASGDLEMVVSIPLQTAWVFRGGVLIGASTVSTGREGHETPTGSYPILQKRRDHRSNLYNNAPMPFMQRLTWDGIALHGGEIPGYPASHGCVRLPNDFARQLFSATRLGAVVHIIDMAPSSPEEALMLAGGRPARDNVMLASGAN